MKIKCGQLYVWNYKTSDQLTALLITFGKLVNSNVK